MFCWSVFHKFYSKYLWTVKHTQRFSLQYSVADGLKLLKIFIKFGQAIIVLILQAFLSF